MITTDINKAKEILLKNELIAIPTETVYGLAGNAYNETALKKIFKLKNRPFYNPLIVHLKSASCISDVALEIPESALILADKFSPYRWVLNQEAIMLGVENTSQSKPYFRPRNAPQLPSPCRLLPAPRPWQPSSAPREKSLRRRPSPATTTPACRPACSAGNRGG